MSSDDRAYELSILKKAINTYLDKTLAVTKEALNELVYKRDEIVWEIATKIYTQSGHKVDFSVVRNVVDSRIDILKKQKAADYERLQSQKIEEAQRLLKEEQQRAEVEKCRQNRLVKLAKKLDESGKAKSLSEIFLKVQDIISETLEVDVDCVTLDSHISNDFGADVLDTTKIAMALEEEFEIEIPADILASYYQSRFSSREPDLVACTVGELLDFIHQQIFYEK